MGCMCEMCGCPHTYGRLVYVIVTDHAKKKHKRKTGERTKAMTVIKNYKERETAVFVVPSSDDLSHCGFSCRRMENTVSVN